jgi:hypothetical protein
VATGLRNVEARPTLTTVEPTAPQRPATVGADYNDYDLPPGKRQQAGGAVDGQAALKMDADLDEQLFDVPAFLRRQAD